MSTANCTRCGGSKQAEGMLRGPGQMAFRPHETKFLTLETGDVLTKSTMCLGCGLIEVTGDVKKLSRLLFADEGPGEI